MTGSTPRKLTIAIAAVTVLGACSSSPQQAATTTTAAPRIVDVAEAYQFSSAEVSVESSIGSFTATGLDSTDSNGYDPTDEAEIEISDPDGKGVIITWRAGTEPDVENAFVRVDFGPTPDMQYPDMMHTQCLVTVPTRTPDGVAGSFDCEDLPNFGDSNATLPTAKGTFSASR